MEIKGEFNRRELFLEGVSSKYLYSVDGLSFESIMNLILNDRVENTETLKVAFPDFLNLKFDKLEEHLSKKVKLDKSPFRNEHLNEDNILMFALFHGTANLEISSEDVRDAIDKHHYTVGINDDNQKTLPANLSKDVSFVNGTDLTPLDSLIDANTQLVLSNVQERESSIDNLNKAKVAKNTADANTQSALLDIQSKGAEEESPEVPDLRLSNSISPEQRHVDNLNKNKVDDGIKSGLKKDEPELVPLTERANKGEELSDVYASESAAQRFAEGVKTVQEVRNIKHARNILEPKFFHVKLEELDIRIKLIRDSLNIKVDLKEDFRLPSPQEAYRLVESLSQMGLRVEYLGISGKNLQWEFRQDQENKREGKFKGLNASLYREKESFSLYL